MKEEIKKAIFEALGEASMMWNPRPSNQVFDSTGAKEIGDRLIEKIEALSQQPPVAVAWPSDFEKKLTDFLIKLSKKNDVSLFVNADEISERFVFEYKQSIPTIDLEDFLKWYVEKGITKAFGKFIYPINNKQNLSLTFQELIAKYNEYKLTQTKGE